MTITEQADYFTSLQRGLQEAQTLAQIEDVARRMDDKAFGLIPAAAREDLAALYLHRVLMITGAFTP